jgi:hypothetical protein
MSGVRGLVWTPKFRLVRGLHWEPRAGSVELSRFGSQFLYVLLMGEDNRSRGSGNARPMCLTD